MNAVFVFPGQGSQYPGMGRELFSRYPQLVREADDILGYSLRRLCVEDPDRVLSQTQFTQPALYVVNILTYLDRMANGGAQPAWLAGHSLGEYCALQAAGAFDFGTGLRLVKKRGELMSKAPKGAMAAVLEIDQYQVNDILARLPYRNIDLANINSQKQVILSGIYEEVFAPDVEAAFIQAGAKFLPLNVSAAFHSRCMIGVQREFANYLQSFDFGHLRLPVVANYTARPYPATGYLDYLTEQISNPVRWYESISWLHAQGCRQFIEIGPGDVLTKLTQRITDAPMAIKEPAPSPKPKPSVNPAETPLVFMYAGQGSQYYQMGRELFLTNRDFKQSMEACNAVYENEYGHSLLDILYDANKRGAEFDVLTHTHPALFSIGYALTHCLRQSGIVPSAVLGHSLGEYIALTVAGVMSFEAALQLVIKQSQLIRDNTLGGMMSIIASLDLYHRRPDVFDGAYLAGVNFSNNFFVSGHPQTLEAIQQRLDREEKVLSVKLPVRHGFHSPLIEPVKSSFLRLARTVPVARPTLEVYSSMLSGKVDNAHLEDAPEFFWRIVREPVKFDALMRSEILSISQRFFVDLSASGTFATFLKYGGGNVRCGFAINQFGRNAETLATLEQKIRQAQIDSSGSSARSMTMPS